MNSSVFKALQKRSSQSFHQQKKFIKNALLGKENRCPECGKLVTVSVDNTKATTTIRCEKLCTDLQLDS